MAGDVAFVTCQNGDELSVIDLNTGSEIDRWPVPGKPAGVAVTEARTVFAVSPDSKTVRRFSAQNGKVEAEVSLDGGPIGVAHDPWRGRLFVTD